MLLMNFVAKKCHSFVDASNTKPELESEVSYTEKSDELISDIDVNLSSINEFQMSNSNNDNNSNIEDNSCLVFERSIIDEKQRHFTIKTSQISICSESKHVLCEVKSTIGFHSQEICYQKPLTLGLPAVISNYLTNELCVSVCETLGTRLAIINMNKCYCVRNSAEQVTSDNTNYINYRTKNCGNPCSGNENQRCGNTDTVVVLDVYRNQYLLQQQKPYSALISDTDFVYDSCVYFNSKSSSRIYQFNLLHKHDVHPHYCLELCAKYQQQYALLNSNRCLCTNIQMKKDLNKEAYRFILQDFPCNQHCLGNYFYSCGSSSNSTIYSVYTRSSECPYGFQIIGGKRPCVHLGKLVRNNSYTTAQSYCKSMGGVLAKINDIVEIQDLLPQYMLGKGYFDKYPFSNSQKIDDMVTHFWIDRVSHMLSDSKISDRLISKCFNTSKSIDRNCIALDYERVLIDGVTAVIECFSESDQCSLTSTIPVCVDKNLESHLSIMPSMENGDLSNIKVNISTDYLCGNDTDYHLIGDYCYKVLLHETTWHEAKAECEREKAKLFLPEKGEISYLVEQLFLHRRSYTSSDIAHIDVFYDNQNLTTTQCQTSSTSSFKPVFNLDAVD
ncbi:unnamed protein product, partial [Rotaria sordida]